MSVSVEVLFGPTLALSLTVCGPNPPVFVAVYAHWAGRLELFVIATSALRMSGSRVMLIATAFVGAPHCCPAGTLGVTEPDGQLVGVTGAHWSRLTAWGIG